MKTTFVRKPSTLREMLYEGVELPEDERLKSEAFLRPEPEPEPTRVQRALNAAEQRIRDWFKSMRG